MNSTFGPPGGLPGVINKELLQSIEVHKYFVNRGSPVELSWDDAYLSWRDLIYEPVTSKIRQWGLEEYFSEVSLEELVLRVSSHWLYLKENQGSSVTADQAVLDYGTQFIPGRFHRFLFSICYLESFPWDPWSIC